MSNQFPLPYSSTDLTGQVALVTGASSGLGARFARVLAASGAKVAAAARRVDRLETLAKEIRSDGGECAAVALDMTDSAQIVAAAEAAERELGTVTILINNAGIPDAQYATKMSAELIDQVIDMSAEQLRREQSGGHRVGRRREMQRRERVPAGEVLGVEREERRVRDRVGDFLGHLNRSPTVGSVVEEAEHRRELGAALDLRLAQPLPAERVGAIEPGVARVQGMQQAGQHRRLPQPPRSQRAHPL